MSELLGNKFCIDSLIKDVKDVQSILSNLTSRTGPAAFKSWKFPDKLACEVNVAEFVEMYEYDEDFQEENKLSHVMLLELVIDRLLYFIQCSSKYADQTLAAGRIPSAVDSSTSLGVVTKKYWNKMVQIYSTIQQDHSELKTQKKRIIELQDFNQQLQDELVKYQQGVTIVPTNSTTGSSINGSSIPPATSTTPFESIAKDNSNKCSQTLETAFVPCESCHRVQASLCSVGDVMSGLCKDQGVPSLLVKFRKQLKGIDWYTANDIARWSAEQNKDINRVNKHLMDLMNTIEPLKRELSGTLDSCRRLEKRVSECEREVELEKETQRIQLNNHVTKVEMISSEHKEVKTQLEQEKQSLEINKAALDKRLREAKKQLEIEKSKYDELDHVKDQLMVELEESKTNNTDVKRLEGILASLEQEMNANKCELVEAETLLSQEQAINKSLNKRTESLQVKYDSLLKQVDEMDNENIDLQAELSSLSEEKEALERTLAAVSSKNQSGEENAKKLMSAIESERIELKNKIQSLEATVSTLENDLSSVKEREKLLVEYPDLNGPVNPDYQGSGDLAVDMSNQVQANEVRIGLLDKQNSTLRKTLHKLEERASMQPAKTSTFVKQPQQLWSHADSVPPLDTKSRADSIPYLDTRVSSSAAPVPNPGNFTVSRSPEKQSRRNKAPSGDNSGVDAYIKLKKAGLIKAPSRPAQHGISGSQSFCCPRCDKLYHTAADLELHKSYCTK